MMANQKSIEQVKNIDLTKHVLVETETWQFSSNFTKRSGKNLKNVDTAVCFQVTQLKDDRSGKMKSH